MRREYTVKESFCDICGKKADVKRVPMPLMTTDGDLLSPTEKVEFGLQVDMCEECRKRFYEVVKTNFADVMINYQQGISNPHVFARGCDET